MSRDYSVVCMECGEWHALGKSYKFHNISLKKDLYGFAFISDGHDDDFEKSDQITIDMVHRHWRYLQHFLMRHRGHEIRVLPEALIGPYETEFFPQYSPGDPAASWDYAPVENYYLAPVGVPDQDEDAKAVSEDVVRRLEEMSRGENLKTPSWKE